MLGLRFLQGPSSNTLAHSRGVDRFCSCTWRACTQLCPDGNFTGKLFTELNSIANDKSSGRQRPLEVVSQIVETDRQLQSCVAQRKSGRHGSALRLSGPTPSVTIHICSIENALKPRRVISDRLTWNHARMYRAVEEQQRFRQSIVKMRRDLEHKQRTISCLVQSLHQVRVSALAIALLVVWGGPSWVLSGGTA